MVEARFEEVRDFVRSCGADRFFLVLSSCGLQGKDVCITDGMGKSAMHGERGGSTNLFGVLCTN